MPVHEGIFARATQKVTMDDAIAATLITFPPRSTRRAEPSCFRTTALVIATIPRSSAKHPCSIADTWVAMLAAGLAAEAVSVARRKRQPAEKRNRH